MEKKIDVLRHVSRVYNEDRVPREYNRIVAADGGWSPCVAATNGTTNTKEMIAGV